VQRSHHAAPWACVSASSLSRNGQRDEHAASVQSVRATIQNSSSLPRTNDLDRSADLANPGKAHVGCGTRLVLMVGKSPTVWRSAVFRMVARHRLSGLPLHHAASWAASRPHSASRGHRTGAGDCQCPSGRCGRLLVGREARRDIGMSMPQRDPNPLLTVMTGTADRLSGTRRTSGGAPVSQNNRHNTDLAAALREEFLYWLKAASGRARRGLRACGAGAPVPTARARATTKRAPRPVDQDAPAVDQAHQLNAGPALSSPPSRRPAPQRSARRRPASRALRVATRWPPATPDTGHRRAHWPAIESVALPCPRRANPRAGRVTN
jgi:hypothetical protein